MNTGINAASGKIIFILNSDDKFQDKNVISSYLKLFKKSNCDLIYSKIKIYDKQFSKKIRTWIPPEKILNSNLIKGILPPHPGFVVKKEIYEKYGVFNLKYKISSDFDLVLRLLKHKKINKMYLNKFTILMRHGGASSNSIFALFKKYGEFKNFKSSFWYKFFHKFVLSIFSIYIQNKAIYLNK